MFSNIPVMHQLMPKLTSDLFGPLDLSSQPKKFPFYDIVKNTETGKVSIRFALSGFNKDNLKVYREHDSLVVSGTAVKQSNVEFVHKGISNKSFFQVITLPKDTDIGEVTFKDGILEVNLREIEPPSISLIPIL